MKGDFTRLTFEPTKRYTSVRMQQGRVQLDADWNEQADIHAYLDRTRTIDVVGLTGAPKGEGSFAVAVTPNNADLAIGAGRFYVDGLLCELASAVVAVASFPSATQVTLTAWPADDAGLQAGRWVAVAGDGVATELRKVTTADEAARTLTVTPALGPVAAAPNPTVRPTTTYLTQPDLPSPPPLTATPVAGRTDLVYLEAWEREVTSAEDPDLLEPALGGADTATRTKTVWQIRVLEGVTATGCGDVAGFPPPSSGGRLSNDVSAAGNGSQPCFIPPSAGYRGLENRLYRVEIHSNGTGPTYKWSRDNGSSVFAIEELVNADASGTNRIRVRRLGRDEVLAIQEGQFVEVLDDDAELAGRPGTVVQVTDVDETERILTLSAKVQGYSVARHARARRWETAPVPVSVGTQQALGTDGVLITLDGSGFASGDHWLFAARTATGDVERLTAAEPRGIRRHYAPLALVRWTSTDGTVSSVVEDCRAAFPPLTAIEAEDVAFDNAVSGLVTTGGEGADTVQEAIDVLSASHTLRHHNAFLHGWGIVSGLKVVCAEGNRSQVTVREGWLIDRAGNDIRVRERTLPFMKMVDQHDQNVPEADRILKDGVGDAWLVWDPKKEGDFAPFVVERYNPDWKQELEERLATTLLMEFYEDSILDIRAFMERELKPPPGQENDPAGPQQELTAALANVFAQRVNPQAGQHLLVTQREHDLLKRFYAGLKEELSLETFCGLFDTARPYPDELPAAIQGLRTIFGRGQHLRLRLRPGGREAYSVGPGINPTKAATTINRWDLEKGVLVAQIDPLAGAEQPRRRDRGAVTKTDTGAGAVSDIAFLDDGKTIVVTAPTRNGQDTLFRTGTIRRDSIDWGNVLTICDLRVRSLATTAADPGKVYAIAHKPEGKKFVGDGLYRIDPVALAAGTQPVRVGAQFNAVGHLRLTANGEAWATEAVVGQDVGTYTSVRHFPNVASADGASDVVSLEGLKGRDDIAVYHAEDGAQATTLYAVAETTGGSKVLVAYRGTTRVAPPLPLETTAHRLEPYAPTGMLLVTSEDGYAVRLVDMRTHERVTNFVPMQLGPIAVASDPARNRVLVLNYLSSTLVVGDGNLFAASPAFPVAALAAYRQAAVNAYNDLLARFLEYLKDCLCEHLLVASPDTTADTRLYLCAVTIRRQAQQSRVYKVCNLSRRRYVKSLPAIGHWLSLVPVLPFLDLLVERFCCWVLPDRFDGYAAAEFDEDVSQSPQTRFRLGTARQGTDTAQAFDALGTIGQLFGKFLQFGKVTRDGT